MKNKIMNIIRCLPLVFLTACAGTYRGCSAGLAERFGADWIVVQYKASGEPFNCWRLNGRSIGKHSDGIYWTSNEGHLIHISGWYNRVQVASGNWDGAASQLGIELNKCNSGAYPSK